MIGDVSGKGMPAAMTVSLLVGTVRTLAHYTQSPGEILTAMNQRMLARSQGGFTTCLVLRLDANGKLTVANAGHLAPYINGSESEPGERPSTWPCPKLRLCRNLYRHYGQVPDSLLSPTESWKLNPPAVSFLDSNAPPRSPSNPPKRSPVPPKPSARRTTSLFSLSRFRLPRYCLRERALPLRRGQYVGPVLT